METFTPEEVENRREIGKISNVPVRFFIEAIINHPTDCSVDFDVDFVECTEEEFLEASGVITYERHTVSQNGVSQIVLTKSEEL